MRGIFGKRSGAASPAGIDLDRLQAANDLGHAKGLASAGLDFEGRMLALFSMKVQEACKPHGTRLVRDVPERVQRSLDGLHAAMFRGDADFAASLAVLSEGQREVLTELRHEVSGERMEALARSGGEVAAVAAVGGKPLDLVTELGGRDAPDLEGRLAAWLPGQAANPALWHEIVWGSRPGRNVRAMLYIVQRDECDFGTAALAFHRARALDLLVYEDRIAAVEAGHVLRFDLVAAIAFRADLGRFARSDFGFSLEDDAPASLYRAREAEARANFGASPFPVPENLLNPYRGRQPVSPYFYNDSVDYFEAHGVPPPNAARRS